MTYTCTCNVSVYVKPNLLKKNRGIHTLLGKGKVLPSVLWIDISGCLPMEEQPMERRTDDRVDLYIFDDGITRDMPNGQSFGFFW